MISEQVLRWQRIYGAISLLHPEAERCWLVSMIASSARR